MKLSDKTIKELLATDVREGGLEVYPVDDTQLSSPASIDLRLGKSFARIDYDDVGHVSLTQPIPYTETEKECCRIEAGEFMLATTREYIVLPDDLGAAVWGRSSIGRAGLFVHNAGWVDPGFRGELTLELFNALPVAIKLESGTRICQITLERIDRPVANPYSGKYTEQRGATGSRIFLDKEVGGNGETQLSGCDGSRVGDG